MFDDDQEWKEKFDEAARAQQEGKYDYAEHTWFVAVEEAEVFGASDKRLAMTLDKLCEFLLLRGKLKEAGTYGYRALDIYERSLGPNSDELANILANLAMLAKTHKNMEEAERLYRRALAVNSRVFGSSEPKVKQLLNEFANVLETLGRSDEADQLRGTKKASQSQIPVFPSAGFKSMPKAGSKPVAQSPPQNPPQSPAQIPAQIPPRKPDPNQQSGAFKALSSLMGSSSGHPAFSPQAETAGQQAQAMQKARDFKTLNAEAESMISEGKHKEATDLYKEFVDNTPADKRKTPDYCHALESLAKIKTKENEFGEAAAFLEESRAIKKQVLGPEHALVGMVTSDLARCYYTIQDYSRAEQLAIGCININSKVYGEGSLELANACHNLGTLYHVQNKYDQAQSYYDKALPVKKRLLGDTHQETIKLKNAIANLQESLKKLQQKTEAKQTSSEISGAWRAIPVTETKPGWWKEDLFGEE